MTLAKDFEDFLMLLNKHQVEYMVVGGYALAFHGKPRHTGDLDIWINISPENARSMVQVVKEFGMQSLGLEETDFLRAGYITQIGYPPLRIDILNHIDGLEFKEAKKEMQILDTDGLLVTYIGLHDFVKNKLASGRPQDLSDIKEIRKALPVNTLLKKKKATTKRKGHGL
jgi:predicted nucleotidyltransferase